MGSIFSFYTEFVLTQISKSFCVKYWVVSFLLFHRYLNKYDLIEFQISSGSTSRGVSEGGKAIHAWFTGKGS